MRFVSFEVTKNSSLLNVECSPCLPKPVTRSCKLQLIVRYSPRAFFENYKQNYIDFLNRLYQIWRQSSVFVASFFMVVKIIYEIYVCMYKIVDLKLNFALRDFCNFLPTTSKLLKSFSRSFKVISMFAS